MTSFSKRDIKNKQLDDDKQIYTNDDLLNKLKLTDYDYLKRAAFMHFQPDPDQFVSGAFVKISFSIPTVITISGLPTPIRANSGMGNFCNTFEMVSSMNFS